MGNPLPTWSYFKRYKSWTGPWTLQLNIASMSSGKFSSEPGFPKHFGPSYGHGRRPDLSNPLNPHNPLNPLNPLNSASSTRRLMSAGLGNSRVSIHQRPNGQTIYRRGEQNQQEMPRFQAPATSSTGPFVPASHEQAASGPSGAGSYDGSTDLSPPQGSSHSEMRLEAKLGLGICFLLFVILIGAAIYFFVSKKSSKMQGDLEDKNSKAEMPSAPMAPSNALPTYTPKN